MHTHVWRRRPGAEELSVSGPVEVADIEPLRSVARRLRSPAGLVVDLHKALVSDLVLVQLATELGLDGSVALVGLSRHQARLLRYHDLGLRPGQRPRAQVQVP